ncbi:hypothetical protein GCM10010371_69250 [Streptomyces subrutilus]|uniref:Uncharacterized protein n=1 Tax=Streptomyces subrutilus TaxID=36818 RepID=A0A918RIH2_9ACTN|nr:hypothetical protein [Streptomyces subrutilus]GHA00128.1 hypothetical protein GCM10010371_69250 [Streptomyces subrutilus]
MAFVLLWPAFILYALTMAGFSALVGSKTSWRMGILMATGTIAPPLALCTAAVLPP